MSDNALCCSRYVESFLPPPLLDKVVLGTQHSVVDAFLGEIEYGKDYIVSTRLVKENWADGFGTKYTYFLKFDEIVRCKDCKYAAADQNDHDFREPLRCGFHCMDVKPDRFCAWGERKDNDGNR